MTQHTPPNFGPLKIGVAGAGVMGRNHARVLSELRDVELTTVFDPDAVTAEGVAEAYGATAVTTAQAFVAAGLDAAVIATPNRFHAELGVALLNINLGHNFLQSALYGFSAAVGFSLVMVLFAAIRERLAVADVPAPFRGNAIALITAGLMSLAFMGFSGLVKL